MGRQRIDRPAIGRRMRCRSLRPARAGAPAAAARDRTGMFLLPGYSFAQRLDRGAIQIFWRARLRRRGGPLRPPQPIDRPVRQEERSDPLHRTPPISG